MAAFGAARFSDPGHLNSLGRAHVDSQPLLCVHDSHRRKEARQTAFQARPVSQVVLRPNIEAIVATKILSLRVFSGQKFLC